MLSMMNNEGLFRLTTMMTNDNNIV